MILLNFDIHPELQILMILLKQSSVQKKFALIVRDNSMQLSYIKMSKIDQCSAFEIKVFQQTFG